MNRRGFLLSMLAAAAAPAIVRAESIMRVRPILLPGDIGYSAAMRNLALDGGLFDVGGVGGAPMLRIYTGLPDQGGVLLAELALPPPGVSGGRATFGPAHGQVIRGGTALHFALERDGNTIVRGNVGGLPGDFTIDNACLSEGQVFNLTGLAINLS